MGKTKPKPTKAPKSASAKSTTKKATKSKSPTPLVSPPLTDEQVGPIPGLPTEAQIEQHVGDLSAADKVAFATIRRLLAEHLGSYAAARAWLVTPGRGYEGTPLDAIRDGMAERVLELLNAQWGPNPTYA